MTLCFPCFSCWGLSCKTGCIGQRLEEESRRNGCTGSFFNSKWVRSTGKNQGKSGHDLEKSLRERFPLLTTPTTDDRDQKTVKINT